MTSSHVPGSSALHVLQGASRPAASAPRSRPSLVIAGATGALGSEVLRRLAGSGCFTRTQVLASEPMATALAQVAIAQVGAGRVEEWPVCASLADTGVVMFEPPRLYHDRERALWTPHPGQLLPLAQWFRRCGVQTLVVVIPHAQGRLPQALRHGLANLDEQQVAALGFERVLLLRSARKEAKPAGAGVLEKTASWMLSVMSYMVPASAQPVRPSRIAEFVDLALRMLPPGTHVAGPELLWQAGQASDMRAALRAWLNTGPGPQRT